MFLNCSTLVSNNDLLTSTSPKTTTNTQSVTPKQGEVHWKENQIKFFSLKQVKKLSWNSAKDNSDQNTSESGFTAKIIMKGLKETEEG